MRVDKTIGLDLLSPEFISKFCVDQRVVWIDDEQELRYHGRYLGISKPEP